MALINLFVYKYYLIFQFTVSLFLVNVFLMY